MKWTALGLAILTAAGLDLAAPTGLSSATAASGPAARAAGDPVVRGRALHGDVMAAGRTPRRAGACPIAPYGLIGATWNKYYVSSGIGCPINNERDVQGRRGRIQDFVNGQIAWSPDQAPKMTVWSIKNKNQIHVRWNTNDNYSYDFYIIRWYRNSGHVGQKDISGTTEGWWTFNLDQPGWYDFIVEGCLSRTFGAKCTHGWTIPVGMRIEPGDIPPPPGRPAVVSPPQIRVGYTGPAAKATVHVTGSRFTPNHEVRIRAVNNANPQITASFFTKADAYGRVDYTTTGSLWPLQAISFSATDGRSNSRDLTGFLWSNTETVRTGY